MAFTDSPAFSISISGAPAWFANQTERTWSTPVSNTIHAVRPSPLPPGVVPDNMSVSSANIMSPWSGGTTDLGRKSVICFGGGHGDYGGNEVYECVLDTASPAWTRITNPSSTGGGSVATGEYGDGQPRSFHTYGFPCYAENVAKVIMPASSAGHSTGGSGSGMWRLERNPNTWTRLGNSPGSYPGGGVSGEADAWSLGSAAYDSVTGLVIVSPSNRPFFTLNPSTGATVLRSSNPPYNYSRQAAIAPNLRCMAFIRDGVLATYRIDQDSLGSASASGLPSNNAPGIVWHPASNAFLVWGTGATIHKLTPSAGVFTGTWTRTTVTNNSGGATPTTPRPNGTFGRFGIIRDLGGPGVDALTVINQVDQALYVYKLPAGGV